MRDYFWSDMKKLLKEYEDTLLELDAALARVAQLEQRLSEIEGESWKDPFTCVDAIHDYVGEE